MKRLLLVLTGTAVLLASSAVAVNAQQAAKDESDLQRARTVAAAIAAPTGASDSGDCNGDGIVACWTVPQSVERLTRDLSESLAKAAETATTTTCDKVPVGTTGTPMRADACFVRVRYEGHGVFIWVDPLTERDETGLATVVGSRVVVQAA